MCLIVFAWRPGHLHPLVVAGNRDEYHTRPTAPLGRWPDAPGVLAGRDLEAGGTWLGIGAVARFAALTNIRAASKPVGGLSRGLLAADFLRGEQAPMAYLETIAAQAGRYAGFNLLVSDRDTLAYLNSIEGRPRSLEPGVYGLSNAALDSPWPKLVQARDALATNLESLDEDALFALLACRNQADEARLPSTGISPDWERMLSSAFIVSHHYGTRASTVVIRDAEGDQVIVERRFDRDGRLLGETRGGEVLR